MPWLPREAATSQTRDGIEYSGVFDSDYYGVGRALQVDAGWSCDRDIGFQGDGYRQ